MDSQKFDMICALYTHPFHHDLWRELRPCLSSTPFILIVSIILYVFTHNLLITCTLTEEIALLQLDW